MKKLEKKVAVITGGNSGMGLATAILFAEQGAKVAVMGRNKDSLKQAENAIGHGAIGIVSDVTDLSSIKAAYDKVQRTHGQILLHPA